MPTGAVVFARTSDEGRGRGISAFVVDLNQPGVTKEPYSRHGHQGRRAAAPRTSTDVRVPAENMLGEEGKGFVPGHAGLRLQPGADRPAVHRRGPADRRRDLGSTSRDREAFDRPISKFQGVSFPLAEAETVLAAARLLVLPDACGCKDAGLAAHRARRPCASGGHRRPPTTSSTSACCCTASTATAPSSPIEQRLRDVLGLQIGDGTAQIMKLDHLPASCWAGSSRPDAEAGASDIRQRSLLEKEPPMGKLEDKVADRHRGRPRHRPRHRREAGVRGRDRRRHRRRRRRPPADHRERARRAAPSASARRHRLRTRSRRWSPHVKERFGRIDVLVNNAGWDKAGPFVDLDAADWARDHRDQPLRRAQHQQGRAADHGRAGLRLVVNIGSDAGRVGSSGEAVYSAAKGGVIAFTKSTAREMARKQVASTSSAPARPTHSCSPSSRATTRACATR